MTIVSISWLSRSLAIVSMVSITISMSITISISTISMAIPMSITMAIVAIAWLSHGDAKEGDGKGNLNLRFSRIVLVFNMGFFDDCYQKLHVSSCSF